MSVFLYWIDKKSGIATDAMFDVVTNETHESILSLTSHPVEEGSNVTDHARAEPKRLTVEGFVSNTPLLTNPGVAQLMGPKSVPLKIPEKAGGPPIFTPGGLVGAASSAIGNALGLTKGLPKSMTVITPLGAWPDRAKEMFTKLDKAQADRARITVVANRVQTIPNMLIERLAVPRDSASSGGLVFQIDLQQVRIVSSETVSAPEPAERRGMKATSSGSVAAKDAENAAKKAEKEKTIAAGGLDEMRSLYNDLKYR